MFPRPRSKPLLTIAFLILSIALAGSCTRERETWSADSPDSLVRQLTLTPTVAVIRTPSPVGAQTPQPTPESNLTATTTFPEPDGGLPPLPGNETLTPEPPTPTPEPKFTLYKVQAGDSLYTIAVEFGIAVEDIKQHNVLENPNNLRVGQELRILQVEPASAPQQDAGDDEEGYVHVVKAGETLFGIAKRYSVPLNELAKANNIANPGALRTGQRLRIPDAAEPDSTGARQRVHIVQPGETLSEIAVQYGVTPNAIVKSNGLKDPSRIVSGQKLIIP